MEPIKFWMVMRAGGNFPSVRHQTKDAATSEAQRLCQKHQANFFVLEAILMVRVRAIPAEVVRTYEIREDVPF